jgi:hypothetical protein
MDLTAAKGLLRTRCRTVRARRRRARTLKRRHGGEPEKSLPGSTYAPTAADLRRRGALLITVAEAAVEKRLGLTDQQHLARGLPLPRCSALPWSRKPCSGFVAPGELVGRSPRADDHRLAGLRAHP